MPEYVCDIYLSVVTVCNSNLDECHNQLLSVTLVLACEAEGVQGGVFVLDLFPEVLRRPKIQPFLVRVSLVDIWQIFSVGCIVFLLQL